MEVNQWAPILSQVLNSRRTAMSEATGREAYNWAFDWHQQLLQRLMATIGTAIANLGLPYAAAVIDRLQGHLKESVIPAANELKQHDRSDIAELPPPRVGQGLAGIKGKIAGGQQILNTLAEDMTARVIEHVYAKRPGCSPMC